MYKKSEFDKFNTYELREIAKINRKEGGIFENYQDYEIKMLTKRQIITILETENKYIKLRKEI